MKSNASIFVVILLMCAVRPLAAQENWGTFSQSLAVNGYEGKKFRLKAFVRVDGVEPEASARLWARVDKQGGGTSFLDNMEATPIRDSVWTRYVIEGMIAPGSATLSYGVLLQYNGKFYFDDIEVQIEIKKNKWQTIYKADFEKTNFDFASGKNALYKASLTKDIFKNGRHAMVVSGEGVPNYGVNPATGKFAHVNGIDLYYEIYGSGPPLVVLHGNGGSISSAATHYPELMKKYKVIAVDSRAQGRSTDTSAPLTYEQMAADVNALLNELHTDSAFIWGQSDGAILGLILAMDYPVKVKRVLAYGANIQPDSNALFMWAIAGSRKIIQESKDAKTVKLNILMDEYPQIPYTALGRIQAPVLVMAGDRDVIRPEHTLKIFQHIPRAHLCILPGATHGGSWEKEALFLQLMDDFFLKPFTMPDTKDWY